MADILKIEDGVLKSCADKDVTSVTIPDGVTEIGYHAFNGCTSLTSVVIPPSVTKIDMWAFSGCKSLSSVEIPSSVIEIDGKAFEGCNISNLSHPCLTIKNGVAIKDNAVECCVSQSTSIEIPDGVTEIVDYAFSSCKSLSSVVIPPSVTKIGKYAFEGCELLSAVSIPPSVNEIGNGAFSGCNALSSAEIPSSVTKIGDGVFHKCNIREFSHPCLTIKDGLEVKDNKVLSCAVSKITSVKIPNGITKIGEAAFFDCESLTSVEIPSGVTEIGEDAFGSCTSLTSLTVPEGVTKICDYAFSGCTSLSSVEIPSSVTEIGENAFLCCDSLSKVTLGDDFEKVPSEWFDKLNTANPKYEIICTEGSSTYNALKRSPKLKVHVKSLVLQSEKNKKAAEIQKAGVDALLSSLFDSVKDFAFVVLPSPKNATVVIVQVGKNVGLFKLGANSSKWFPKIQKVIEAFADSTKSGEDIFGVINEQNLPLAEIPSKIAELVTINADSNGFLNLFAAGELRQIKSYGGLKNLALFGITKIGEKAFLCCRELFSVEIPSSVTEIGDCAFDFCTSLSSVEIPPSVTEIGNLAFRLCSISEFSHPCLTIKDGIIVKDDTVLYCADSQITSVKIPDGVKKIDKCAFDFCTSLSSVEIPPSVTEIGNLAFRLCSISEFSHPCLTVKNGVAVKDNKVLYPANKSTTVKIHDGITEIVDKAFCDCMSITSVEIPSSVTKIGKYAFMDCTSLSSVVIPDSVTEIGNSAFWECTSLASVSIPSSITQIGNGSFSWCESLESVSIPPSVTKIGNDTFCGCTSLSSVEFGGTVAQWQSVEKGDKWNDNIPATCVKCTDGEAEL